MPDLYQSLSHSRWHCKYHVVLVARIETSQESIFGLEVMGHLPLVSMRTIFAGIICLRTVVPLALDKYIWNQTSSSF